MTQDQTRRAGQALMALSVLQFLLFLVAAARRSYLAVAVPVGIGLGVASGLAFWVGYTMASTDWDEPLDYGVEGGPASGEVPGAEGAPPPESIS